MAAKYSTEFLDFVNSSPSPYHVVSNVVKILSDAGFSHLNEKDEWSIKGGGHFYVTRNDSSIIAFKIGRKWTPENGFAVVGAHTDSPCLRVKPVSKKTSAGYLQVGVETYGGGMWPTWLDRDLSLAGRVFVKNNGVCLPKLLKISRPLLRIPTLAIHLERSQGTKLELNLEEQLIPILGSIRENLTNCSSSEKTSAASDSTNPSVESHHCPELLKLIGEELSIEPENIVDFELVLFDSQEAQLGGVSKEFIFSSRLDNLTSCFCALRGLVQSDDETSDSMIRVIALFDHEEVGSSSAQGAASNFLETILNRVSTQLSCGQDAFHRAIAASFLISADMAHAVHPNYVLKHERGHTPQLNQGVVIKINANQRYSTNSKGIVILQEIAKRIAVPLQLFVVRNDAPCGSTIGPILATRLGIVTIDVGAPQLSMHSIREMCGVKDLEHAIELYRGFFSLYSTANLSVMDSLF